MNARVNVNELFDPIKPGRLTLDVDGKDYVVRPLTNLEVKHFFDSIVGAAAEPETLDWLGSIVEGDRPPFEAWAVDGEPKLGAFVRAIAVYYSSMRAKKVDAVEEAIRRQWNQTPSTS